jgi:hypothetical protein
MKKMVLMLLLFVMAGCGGGGGGGSSTPAGGGGAVTFQAAKSNTNSFYPTSDGVNTTNQPVSLHWTYVLSGSSQTITNDGHNYTLQSYEEIYDPSSQKLTYNVIVNASGNGLTGGVLNESGSLLLMLANSKLFSKESYVSQDKQGTQNGQFQHVTLTATQINQSPYLEVFPGRSDIGSLAIGFTTNTSVTATQTITSSTSGTSTQSGQLSYDWRIANIYPSMTIQGKTYNNVIEVTMNDVGKGTTSTTWVAKGIGIIKETRPVDSLGGYVATFELKDTNLSQ